MAGRRFLSVSRLLTCAAVMSLPFAACGDSRGTPTQFQPEQFTLCGASTSIAAARINGELRFSWAPTCGAGRFTVQNEGGTATLWTVTRADGLASIAGPIIYGTAPAGTQTTGGAPPLQPGTVVRVVLSGATASTTTPAVLVSAQVTVP